MFVDVILHTGQQRGIVLPEFSCASQLLPRWTLVGSLALPLLSSLAGLPHSRRVLGDCMLVCLGCDRRSVLSLCLSTLLALLPAGLD